VKTDFHLTWLVARRELVDQLRDWRILMPMFVLILFFPFLMNFTAFQVVNFTNQYGGDLVADQIVPLLLMVVGFFPVTVSLIVALEAFVGEKERGTIEPLLSSPLDDSHIYVGKLLAGTLVPLTASYVSMGLYLIGLVWQSMPFPPLDVLIQMFLLTAVQAMLMVSLAIVISTQSTTVKAANLLASFIVLPVAFLLQAESSLIFWGKNDVLWLAIVGIMVITGLIVRLGLSHFQRESLLGREIDLLNLKWVLLTLWTYYSGSEQAPAFVKKIWLMIRPGDGEKLSAGQVLKASLADLRGWYAGEVFPTLKRMTASIWIYVILGLLVSVAAYYYTLDLLDPAKFLPAEREKLLEEAAKFVISDKPLPEITFSFVFFNNLRVELIMFFLGIFTFGVAAVLIFIINFGVIGAAMAVTQLLGFSPLTIFMAGVFPHGVFELPSVLLVGVASLYMGVRMVTPSSRDSISEVFLQTLADWFKIAFGLAFPLLFIAALVEVYITPILLYNFLP
jgi:uncharacterized membrane protein SpoIIM required for sporulation